MSTPLPPSPSDAKKATGPRLMLAAAISVGVVVLLFGMFSKPPTARPAGSSPPPTEPSARAAPVRTKPAFSRWLLASSILELNSTNEIAVEQETKGENRFLLGTVAMVRTDAVSGEPMLMFGSIPFVRASFKGAATPPDLATLGKLQAGDLVGLRCTGRGKVALSISFDECEIVWLAKETDPLNLAVSTQLCQFELIEQVRDGGTPTFKNDYFDDEAVKRVRTSDVPPKVLADMKMAVQQLNDRVRTENIPRIPCDEPELWAIRRCDGEKEPECVSPQMKQFTNLLLR